MYDIYMINLYTHDTFPSKKGLTRLTQRCKNSNYQKG
jgi:hypothetical protein